MGLSPALSHALLGPRRAFLAIAIAALSLAPAANAANAPSCPALSIDFIIEQGPARVDQTHSHQEFSPHSAAYFSDAGAKGLDRRSVKTPGVTLGLYSSNRKIKSEHNLTYSPLPGGAWDICLASIAIRYSVAPVIYLAREIPRGPCLDDVYQHELAHLDIDYNAALRGRASLAQWAPGVPNRARASSSAEATLLSSSLLNSIVERAFDHVFNAQASGHHQLDGLDGSRVFGPACSPLVRSFLDAGASARPQ